MRCFNPALARAVGIPEAVFIQQVHFKCSYTPKAPGDQFSWWAVTLKDIAFDLCMTDRSARTLVSALEEKALVVTRQTKGIDRTMEYRVDYFTLYKMCPPPANDENAALLMALYGVMLKSEYDAEPAHACGRNFRMEEEIISASHARDLLPDSKSTQKTHVHGAASAPSEKPQRAPKQSPPEIEPHWSEFVATYPPRDGNLCRSEGQRIFARLAAKGEDLAAVVKGARGYRRHCDDKGSTGGPYVKQIPSFLNGRCWEEWMQAATRGVTQQTRIGGPINERQLAKDREAAIRKAAIFGCSVGEIDKRFADE